MSGGGRPPGWADFAGRMVNGELSPQNTGLAIKPPLTKGILENRGDDVKIAFGVNSLLGLRTANIAAGVNQSDSSDRSVRERAVRQGVNR
jgi:hypothetical protein